MKKKKVVEISAFCSQEELEQLLNFIESELDEVTVLYDALSPKCRPSLKEINQIIVETNQQKNEDNSAINLLPTFKETSEIQNLASPPFPVETSTDKLTQVVNLSEWFKGIFTSRWQSLNTFLDGEKTLAYNTLSGSKSNYAEGGKLIKVDMDLGKSKTVLLVIKIQQIAEEQVEITAQLSPTGGNNYLPSNLKLARLSKSGKVRKEVISESMSNYIKCEFTGKPGGRFGIQVTYRDVQLICEYYTLE